MNSSAREIQLQGHFNERQDVSYHEYVKLGCRVLQHLKPNK